MIIYLRLQMTNVQPIIKRKKIQKRAAKFHRWQAHQFKRVVVRILKGH
jgi:hypothetical protein